MLMISDLSKSENGSARVQEICRRRIFLIVFAAALFSKGTVLFSAFSIDDYAFAEGVDSNALSLFFQQGRYVLALVNYFVESLDVGINSLYFPLGLTALLLHSAFVVSLLEFSGVLKARFAALSGAIIVTHPYSSEIYTYKLALAGYCVALLFSTLAIIALLNHKAGWKNYLLSLVALLGMLFTYQSFLNYFAVLAIFLLIVLCLNLVEVFPEGQLEKVLRKRFCGLILILTAALVVFVLVLQSAKRLGFSEITSRGRFIKPDQLEARLAQALNAVEKIYWGSEPIFPQWLKIFFGVILVLFFCIVISRSINNFFAFRTSEAVVRLGLLTTALLVLGPVSIGVVLVFDDWWPVPRVIAHVAFIYGLIFLIASYSTEVLKTYWFRCLIGCIGLILVVSFTFLSNQIFVDQLKINRWDMMKVNRILSRFEADPAFGEVKAMYVDGGSWRYPERLRTIQGDMNVSAFFPEHSKISLIAESTGHRFGKPTLENSLAGRRYCDLHKSWPNSESIVILGDLGVVCLGRLE